MTSQCVDRLTILDGVAVAIGWSVGGNPSLTINGERTPLQTCIRFNRVDLAPDYGPLDNAFGFRIAAPLLNAAVDGNALAVRFANGEVNRCPGGPEEGGAEALLARFQGLVAAAETPSLIEIGSRARSGNSYRSLFPTVAYTGVDIAPGPNVDIVADVHALSGAVDRLYDFAFSISVFEHLIMPWVAAYELAKTLKIGGVAYIQSHPSWPLHDQPWDFFRFSREGWHGLFNPFTGFEIIDTAYGIKASVVPNQAGGGALMGIDLQPTFLLSCCLVRKIHDPRVDWSADASSIYNLHYSH